MTVGEVFDFTVSDSSLIGLLQKINSFTDVGQGGILGIFILVVVGGALVLMLRGYGNERAFPVAGIVISIIGIFLKILGLIIDSVLWICIAIFVVSVIYLVKEQGQYE
jgi:hypothetical protein